MPEFDRVILPEWAWKTLQVLLIVVVAFAAIRISRSFVHGVFQALLDREMAEGTAQDLSAGEARKRMETLDGLGAGILRFSILVIAGLMILGTLGIDIGPAIAGLGIAGIAIGFGAQSLVKDYFNGALILIENQYGRGDVIKVANVEGTVEDLSLRRTTLRDFDGNVHTVPNSAIVVTSNLTRGWARVNEDLQVPSADLVDTVSEIVDRVGREMAADPAWHRWLLDPPHVERIDAMGPHGITLKITARVSAGHRWTAVGEMRRRLLEAFREKGLPFVPTGSAGANGGATPGAPSVASSPGAPPAAEPAASLDTTTAAAAAAVDTVTSPGAAPGQDHPAQGTG